MFETAVGSTAVVIIWSVGQSQTFNFFQNQCKTRNWTLYENHELLHFWHNSILLCYTLYYRVRKDPNWPECFSQHLKSITKLLWSKAKENKCIDLFNNDAARHDDHRHHPVQEFLSHFPTLNQFVACLSCECVDFF